MKKVVLILSSVLISGGLIWYLFIYPYDYVVTFEAKANTGTINQSVKLWNNSLDHSQIRQGETLGELQQSLVFGDSLLTYDWEISPVNDSVSRVRVYIKDSEHSLENKIKVPFFNTPLENRSRKSLKEFGKLLSNHLKNIKVEIKGEGLLDGKYYAYVRCRSKQFGKAGEMMQNFPLLDEYLVENGVQLDGKPFIEVLHWDQMNDSLEFNFCYPIIRNDSLPEHPDLKYGYQPPKKALIAVYNGNYMTSDRAWYELLDYAQRNHIEVTGNPVEVFYNNPNLGVDEINWKAEVFMPLAEP